MTNEEILEKAIQRAEENGYSCHYDPEYDIEVHGEVFDHDVKGVIFDHDFAKAFFGREMLTTDLVDCPEDAISPVYIQRYGDEVRIDGMVDFIELPAWQFHLQQMVLEKEPLKYLKKFL